MPAGITDRDGMMYTGQKPWHGLGVELDNPATAAEAIEAAELGWEVTTQPVYTRSAEYPFAPREIPNKRAVVRVDTQEPFAVMGSSYEPVQNRDAFNFFDAVVGQGEAIYHTAGSLYGGKRIWILAKLPEDIQITPEDKIQPYILLSNSHDGSTALRMQLTPIRVVCANTLSVALGSRGGFYAKHTRNVMQRASDARDILGLAHAHFEMFAKQIDQLVNTKMTTFEQQDYFQKVFKFKDDLPYSEQDHRLIKGYEECVELLGHPTNTVGGMQGTKWAALNALTYYIDHEKAIRDNQLGYANDERRLDSSWFGSGAGLRQRGYELLLA